MQSKEAVTRVISSWRISKRLVCYREFRRNDPPSSGVSSIHQPNFRGCHPSSATRFDAIVRHSEGGIVHSELTFVSLWLSRPVVASNPSNHPTASPADRQVKSIHPSTSEQPERLEHHHHIDRRTFTTSPLDRASQREQEEGTISLGQSHHRPAAGSHPPSGLQ